MPVISEEKEELGTSAEGPQDLPCVCPYATAAKFRSDSKGQLSHTHTHTSLIRTWCAHMKAVWSSVSAATAACSVVQQLEVIESCDVIGYHSIVYAWL